MKIRIGLTYDLRQDYLARGLRLEDVAEFDTEETIAALAGAITALGYRVTRIGDARALAEQLAAGRRWDLVFNVAEGLRGRAREAIVPALLELYDIPYTFSDPLTCAVTLDKAVAKRLVRAAGLRTPDFAVAAAPRDLRNPRLRFPVFVKPVAEGTGKGVGEHSRVETMPALRRVCHALWRAHRQAALIEEYLPGREFTTGVLGNGSRARALGTMEIRVRADAPVTTYSFRAKEECERLMEYAPLPRSPLRRQIEALALAAYHTLECRDAARVDIRLDQAGQPHFLEVNPLPGLHPTHSDLPMIAAQAGMSHSDLIGAIIRSALARAPAAARRAGRKAR